MQEQPDTTAVPSLEAFLRALEGDAGRAAGGPSAEDRAWVGGLRAALARDPGDLDALREVEGPRFERVCRALGVAPREGRERFLAAASRSAEIEKKGSPESLHPQPAAPAPAGPGASGGSGRRVVLGAAAVAALVLVSFLLPVREALGGLIAWIDGLGPWGPVVLVPVYVLACVLFLPGSVLTLGAGFTFGLWTGVVAVSVGSVLGASAAFLLGRTVARGWVARRIAGSHRFRAIDAAVGRQGFRIVLLARLSPVFPFNLLNFAFGVTSVRFRDYLLASWIGMLPGTVLYVYLGSAAKSLADLASGKVPGGPAQIVLFAAGLCATVAVTVTVTRIARGALDAAIGPHGDPPPGDLRAPADGGPPVTGDVDVLPRDLHNAALVRNVHPADWTNPEPAPRYDLVVVGAGTAGLVTAAGAAGLGARVALVERHLLGGDCLNYGCVPSKALIRTARAYADVRDAARYGVVVPPGTRVDFGAVMERMRRLRAQISPHDSAARLRGLGVDVFLGGGRFTGPETLAVAGKPLPFRKACIATGARAAAPPIPGLRETGFLTNETLFSLTALPPRLAVIGAGPIGCEIAQAFARFGAEVTLLEALPQILGREDREAAARVHDVLVRDRVRLLLSARVLGVERDGRGKVLRLEREGRAEEVLVDEVLVGVGRAPNVDGLGLEAAGVAYDPRVGVTVDDRLRTTNPRIYAAGDVCSAYKFTHTADALARIVIQNALFLGRRRASALTVPWCTYTDPEVAHVGLYEEGARAKGLRARTLVQEMKDVDRAVLDGEEEGFVKVLLEEGSDRILGATIVARHAGEMLSELTLAMVGGLGLEAIARTIHPYPTQAEAIRRVGDQWIRSRLTPRVAGLLRRWLAWTR